MENVNTAADDWPIGLYPDPNPLFPPPTRPRAGLRWLVSLPMFVGGGPGVVLSLKYWQALGNGIAIGLAFASFIAFLVGIGSFFQSFFHMPWRHGRILPALVESRAGPPEKADSSGCATFFLPPGLELIVELLKLAHRERNPNAMLLKWLDGGRLRTASVLAGKHWGKWEAGDVVWICVLPPFKTMIVEAVCPNTFVVPQAPPEVASRLAADLALCESLSREGRRALRQRIQEEAVQTRNKEAELKRAAQASTQTLKQATLYQKRPE